MTSSRRSTLRWWPSSATQATSRALEDALNLLSDTLLSHLAYEEQQIVEPLARLGFYAGQI